MKKKYYETEIIEHLLKTLQQEGSVKDILDGLGDDDIDLVSRKLLNSVIDIINLPERLSSDSKKN